MLDLLATPRGRRLMFTLLYLSEGAPIGFIWWAMPTRLREAGIDVQSITWLTATLVLPWTFKFLWAPLVDALQSQRWTLKQWIVAAQLLMGLLLVPLLWLDLRTQFPVIVGCLLLHAVAAATQDVAIDALCIRTTEVGERGRLNGWMQAGMLLGRAGLGGGALMLAARIGESGVIILLIGVIWSSLALLLATRWPAELIGDTTHTVRATLGQCGNALVLAARQRNTWLALAFALTGGAAYEGLGIVTGPILVDAGFDSADIGYFFALPVVAAMVFGSLIGGRIADRHPRVRCVASSMLLIVLCATVAGLSIPPLDILPPAREARSILLIPALTGVYLGIGLFTASSYALFMDLTTPEVAGTQFSAFMGATNGCEAASGMVIGSIVATKPYAAGIWLMCLPSLLALFLLRWLKPRP